MKYYRAWKEIWDLQIQVSEGGDNASLTRFHEEVFDKPSDGDAAKYTFEKLKARKEQLEKGVDGAGWGGGFGYGTLKNILLIRLEEGSVGRVDIAPFFPSSEDPHLYGAELLQLGLCDAVD